MISLKSQIFSASAHGRVNLIGEHTDYNGGYVLPMAITQSTVVQIQLRSDSRINAVSTNIQNSSYSFQYILGRENQTKLWIDYLQGVTRVLTQKGIQLSGLEVKISSTVPMGSGLSSSAALQVSFIKALRSAFNFSMDDLSVARLAQRVENEFVGAQVGIMDPMVASLAGAGQLLFIDTKTLVYREIALPLDGIGFLVIYSGISHSNAHGAGFNQRRSQCQEACGILGIQQLRELDLRDLAGVKSRLPEVLFRRVRHVVTENDRVLQALETIEQKNFSNLGSLFNQSHDSMRDDYEVSTSEIDQLVALANQQEEVLGARLTGGGFGGSVLVLARSQNIEATARKICQSFEVKTGICPTLLLSTSSFPNRF